jgi:AAA15 family ATPase/GTPase
MIYLPVKMISQVHIKNFKSIVDLTLDLGRVNLFIGENGSGKSNILEAVAFLASQTNFDDAKSSLAVKGVRTNEPKLYASSFDEELPEIIIEFTIDGYLITAIYDFQEDAEQNWRDIATSIYSRKYRNFLIDYGRFIEYSKSGPNYELDEINIKPGTSIDLISKITEENLEIKNYFNYRSCSYIYKYIIYSPEVSSLRKFEEEGQIRPLGIRGEGLFSLIKSLAADNGSLEHIKEHLEVIDWFEDFSIPTDLMSNEYKISIKDRFINSGLKYLDQRSANEGFLFLLFYIVLFSSKKTPQFFAIDNIEASFNPKLCSKLVNMLVDLSKKNNKQVLMTTHNPATLDGLDLNDPEQRLFVIRRNIDGHTIATRISQKPKIATPMKLSEMWTKGLLGGLPDNF